MHTPLIIKQCKIILMTCFTRMLNIILRFGGKIKEKVDHLVDFQVFERLSRYQVKMNPLKYAFRVSSDKFLGFIMRHHGIKIDQSKIDTISILFGILFSSINFLVDIRGGLKAWQGIIWHTGKGRLDQRESFPLRQLLRFPPW